MRSTGRVRAVLVAVLVVTVAGCGGDPDRAAAPDPSPSDGGPSSPSVSPDPPEGRLSPPEVPAEDPPPCEDVRAGIDAFNAGDPEETVRLFEAAVPDAEAYAADEPGRTADLLLEAVRYYAALPPQQYAAAITGSPEFRRHQVVTLSVCRYGQPADGPTDDAVPA